MEHKADTKAQPIKRPPFNRRLVGLFIGLTIVVFCFYTIGPAKVFESLINVQPLFLLVGFFLIFCWLLLGTMNMKIMLSPLKKIPFLEVFNRYSNANMAALVIPGQIGDAIIVHFFRKYAIPISQGATIFATDKVITLFWYSIFTGCGIYLAGLSVGIEEFLRDKTSIFLFTLACFFLLLCLVLYFLFSLISERILNWFVLSFTYLKQARLSILINIFVTFIRTLVLGCSYWLIINAYGSNPSLIYVLCFSITAGMVAYIPISIYGLGTVEASLVFLFSTIGMEPASILSAALTIRVSTILIVSASAIISNIVQKL